MAAAESVSLIHPNFYNNALRALGVDDVSVAEKEEGGMRAVMGNAGTGQMVNAIAVAYTKLIAAESQIGTLRRVKDVLANPDADQLTIADAIDDLDRMISNLEHIATEA